MRQIAVKDGKETDSATESRQSGMILPAGSPLVQFEITKSGIVVWVNREPCTAKRHKDLCQSHPVFEVERYPKSWPVPPAGHIYAACVCRGRFVE